MRFGSKKREDKLYKQWVKYANLPPEAVPRKAAPTDKKEAKYVLPPEATPPEEIPSANKRRDFNLILYILLGAAILLFCTGIVLILTESC